MRAFQGLQGTEERAAEQSRSAAQGDSCEGQRGRGTIGCCPLCPDPAQVETCSVPASQGPVGGVLCAAGSSPWGPAPRLPPPPERQAALASGSTSLDHPPSGDLEVTVDFLTEVDKLVQLIECPIFTCEPCLWPPQAWREVGGRAALGYHWGGSENSHPRDASRMSGT